MQARAGMNMLRQFLVGGGVSLVNIAIHALIMTMVVQVARAMGKKQPTALLLGFDRSNDPDHLSSDGCAYNRSIRMGFGVLDIRCLGYGDVLSMERWRLLGPLTAMNGMLLYGWSTAVIFEVLRRTLVRTLDIND